jgi:cell division protein FtsA
VLTGGGSMLKHAAQLFEYRTGISCRIGYPNEHLGELPEEAITSPSFATGVGLVLKGYEDHIDPNAVMTTEQQVMQQDEEPFDEERVPLGRNFLKTLRDFFEADEEFQN